MFCQSQKRECAFDGSQSALAICDPFPFQWFLLLITRRTIDQKANGTLPLADGEGSVGDPASEPVSIGSSPDLC